MKIRLKLIILSSCLLVAQFSQAENISSYYCAKTFTPVSVGASMEAIRAACGAPTTINNKQVSVQTSVVTTQWIYTLGLLSINGATISLPSLSIIFSDNKVIEIDKNNLPVMAGGYCSINNMVTIGDTMSSVLFKCGQPNVVSTRQQVQNSTKAVVEWVYNYGPYQQQAIFDFENNTLTQITMGPLGN